MDAQLLTARRARKEIEQVRKQLLLPTPETVAACAGPLAQAIACMEKLQAELVGKPLRSGENSQMLRFEIGLLRSELLQATALLQSAAAYYEGFGQMLGITGDNTPIDYGGRRNVVPIGDGRLILHG